VTWGATLKCHALSAVRILHTVSQCPPVQPKLVGLLSAAPDKHLLLHGFVECLEAEGDEEDEDEEEEEERLASKWSFHDLRLHSRIGDQG
jgi:hypothetical protein